MTTLKTGRFVSGRFYSSIKYKANKRNILFNLDIEFLDELILAQEHRCAYSDLEIDAKTRGFTTASLDRIDSSGAYEPGNVQFLHKDVNMSKWTHSEEAFFNLIDKIYKHRLEDRDAA